ncbi:MAG: SAM-dependent methyltransferase, partial [Pseudomonadota bacterium]
ERVSFIAADAGEHDFGAARFDHFSSRFGAMFFADQTAAFSHLRRFATDGASMFLITWRGAEENGFLTTGPRVVASFLGPPPPANPDGPSPFAMSDPEKVQTTLDKSGWTDIALKPLDLAFGFPASDLDVFMTKLAPLGPGVADADPATQAKIFDQVRAQYTQFVSGDRLTYDAACWAITARAA